MVREEFEPTLARLEGRRRSGRLAPAAGGVRLLPRAVATATTDRLRSRSRTRATAARSSRSTRFHFPRQEGRERLCIADYFRSSTSRRRRRRGVPGRDGGRRGDAALRASCRRRASTARRSTRTASPSRAAEAVAEWMHRRIRRELGIPGGRGKRYSWGYGACPDLEDHAQLFKLLPAEEALGMELTRAFQLMPEQSTAAMIVHHPQAKYYAVRGADGGAERPSPSAPQSRVDRRVTEAHDLARAARSAARSRRASSCSTARWGRCCTPRACSSTSATTS